MYSEIFDTNILPREGNATPEDLLPYASGFSGGSFAETNLKANQLHQDRVGEGITALLDPQLREYTGRLVSGAVDLGIGSATGESRGIIPESCNNSRRKDSKRCNNIVLPEEEGC